MVLRGSLVAREHPILVGITSGLHIAKEGIEELLWPTRCVLCDVPGTLLCGECRLELPYIDPLDACPQCGHPHGKLACVNCNSFITKHRGLAPGERESARGDALNLERNRACTPDLSEPPDSPTLLDCMSISCSLDQPGSSRSPECPNGLRPLDHSGVSHALNRSAALGPLEQIVSVFEFVDPCRKLITTYKDRKEIRLAGVLAELLANYINPAWIAPGDTALVAIPARKQAIRERGFDHMKEVGQKLSNLSGLPLLDILAPGERGDQRGLSASSRQKNMRNSFVPKLPAQVRQGSSAVDQRSHDIRWRNSVVEPWRIEQRRIEQQCIKPLHIKKQFNEQLPCSLYARPARFPAKQEKGIPANAISCDAMLATGVALPANIILVDDVLTTGATLVAGALTLKEMGAQHVFGLTVARLP